MSNVAWSPWQHLSMLLCRSYDQLLHVMVTMAVVKVFFSFCLMLLHCSCPALKETSVIVYSLLKVWPGVDRFFVTLPQSVNIVHSTPNGRSHLVRAARVGMH
uniref:Uncharacterized protein n=1 Tax=Rhipicephalus microplus TaxID=6941 RepID=A0A6G5A2X7_RHIMP